MKRFFLIQVFILSVCLSHAQDTIKVMQYNLLYYGVNTGFCNSNNNNVDQKNAYIRTILNEVKPDILTVCEIATSNSLQNDFVSNNLNINGVRYWATTPVINQSGTNIGNCIFYNSEKLSMKKHRVAQTYVRDIDAYELYFNTDDLVYGDTIKLVCIVAHLKAGLGSENEGKRKLMTQNTMNFIELYYPNDNVLFMGDFNFYASTEPAYQAMVNHNTYPHAYFIDPAGEEGVGEWNNNSQFARYHTQSTDVQGNGCKSSGGMDDRFDFIMMSNEISTGQKKIRFVQDSYWPVGQDGNHFNKSINNPANSSVPTDVANALFNNSDHLPITMKLYVDSKMPVNELNTPNLDVQLYPNPAKNIVNIDFSQQTSGKVRIELLNTVGQLSFVDEKIYNSGKSTCQISLDGLSKGFYIMRVHAADGSARTMKLLVY